MRAFFGAAALAVICGSGVMAQDFGERQVRSVCDVQFGGDDDMVSQCMDSQREAFEVVRNTRITGNDMLKSGIDRCVSEQWPDWQSVRTCSAGELEASLRIERYVGNFHDGGGSGLLMAAVVRACEIDFQGQLRQIDRCLRNTLEAWYETHPLDRPGADAVARQAAEAAQIEADMAALAAIEAREAEQAAREALEAEAADDNK